MFPGAHAISRNRKLDHLRHQVWGTAQGLPSENATSVHIDRRGYIWVGTDAGLARFDGLRFVTFNTATTPGLPENQITDVEELPDGRLVLATAEHLVVVEEDGRMEAVQLPGKYFDNKLCVDGAGVVWVASRRTHIYRWSPGAGVTTHRVLPNGRGDAFRITRADNNRLWISTEDAGAVLWGGAEPVVLDESAGLDDLRNAVSDVVRTEGGLWTAIGRFGRLHRIEAGGLRRLTPPEGPPTQGLTCSLGDSHNTLWTGHMNGELARHDPSGELLGHVAKERMFTDSAMDMREDREGSIWIASYRGGLRRLSESRVYVTPGGTSPRAASCRAVIETEDGSIIVATEDPGVIRMRDGAVHSLTEWNGLSDSFILSLANSHDGGLWIGTYNGSLDKYRDNTVTRLDANVSPGLREIRAMVEEPDGTLWVGTRNHGLFAVKEGVAERVLPSAEVRALHRSRSGRLWVGTHSGLWFVDKGGSPQQHRQIPAEVRIRCFLEDAEGRLWIGTHTDGLYILGPDGVGRAVPVSKGMPANSVFFLAQHPGTGTTWWSGEPGIFSASTSRLLAVSEGREESIRVSSLEGDEGIRLPEPNGGSQPAGLLSRDGILWVPTRRGLVAVDPSYRAATNAAPHPVVEEILVANLARPDLGKAGMESGEGELEITFTGLGVGEAEKVEFSHRLLGSGTAWSNPGTSRKVSYNYLSPGRHTFELRCRLPNGPWSPTPARLEFSVTPRLHQTPGFIVSVIATIAAILLAAHRVRVAVVRRIQRLETEKALESERSRIAREIHDDVGASLTSVQFMTELVSRNSANQAEVSRLSTRIGESTAALLARLDELVWALNPEHDHVDRLILFLGNFGADYLQPFEIPWRRDIPPDLPTNPISADRRHHVYLIVKEALHNVVKHSKATEVWFRVDCRGNEWTLEVSDNGIGFDPAKRRAGGNGLGSMESRTGLTGAKLELKSAPGQGTSIRITLSLDHPQGGGGHSIQ